MGILYRYKQKSSLNAFTRGNFNDICVNFDQYDYVAVDIEDLYRDVQSNLYYKIVLNNFDKYDKQVYEGFEIFTKKPGTIVNNPWLLENF